MEKKVSKKAKLLIVMSFVMSIVMLLGTTFAWFTDSVTSTGNRIVAGTLDVDLLRFNEEMKTYESIKDGSGDIFDATEGGNGHNWEPGKTQVVYLAVKNAGSLALRYNILLNVTDNGLAGALDYAVIRGATNTSVTADSWNSLKLGAETGAVKPGYLPILPAGQLEAEDTSYFALAIHMREEAGNEYQGKDIVIDIKVVATQQTFEEDSFDDQYDADALVCDVLATPETIDEVLASVKPGTVIGLAKGRYDEITLTQNDLTLISNAAVVGYINLNAKDNCRLENLIFDAAGAQPVYKMTKTSGVNEPAGFDANIVPAVNSANGADNTEIINCTFMGTPKNPNKYASMCFPERRRATSGTRGITVDGCTFEVNGAYNAYFYYADKGEFMFLNNTFGTVNGSADYGIYVGQTIGNVTVSGNTFLNSLVYLAPHNSESCTYKINYKVIDNHFNNSTDGPLNVIGIRAISVLSKCSMTVEGNTANYGNTPFVHEHRVKGTEVHDFYSIENGYISSVPVTNEEEFVDAISDGSSVTLMNDIELIAPNTIITEDVIINLNGFKLTADRTNDFVDPASSSVLYISDANVVIMGDGWIENTAVSGGTTPANNLITVADGGFLTIKDGTFIAEEHVVYVAEGKALIEGGYFESHYCTSPNPDITVTYNGVQYTFYDPVEINCHKNNYYNNLADIDITGGTFVNEDPSTLREGGMFIETFVVDGYKVVKEMQANGDAWYTVIPQ